MINHSIELLSAFFRWRTVVGVRCGPNANKRSGIFVGVPTASNADDKVSVRRSVAGGSNTGTPVVAGLKASAVVASFGVSWAQQATALFLSRLVDGKTTRRNKKSAERPRQNFLIFYAIPSHCFNPFLAEGAVSAPLLLFRRLTVY